MLSALLYLFLMNRRENNANITNETARCVQEGEKNYGEAPIVYHCCPGLTDISAIDDTGVRKYDVSYCTQCGDGKCKNPENRYNCMEDCK